MANVEVLWSDNWEAYWYTLNPLIWFADGLNTSFRIITGDGTHAGPIAILSVNREPMSMIWEFVLLSIPRAPGRLDNFAHQPLFDVMNTQVYLAPFQRKRIRKSFSSVDS